MKRIKIILFMFISICLLTGCEDKNFGIKYDVDGNTSDKINFSDNDNPEVAMKINGYGSIVIELYPEVAPNTVNNFISLIKSGFYDGNNFHRLAPGFVLQGGDPNGDGTGGCGYHIQGEFSSNNFKNELKHTKGVVSMARSKLPNSAGSQFFIMLGTATSLDGEYAAFGKVIMGMENIERIEKNAKYNSKTEKLENNIIIKKAIVNTKGKEYSEPEKI